MRRFLKGSVTIEATVIVPMILLVVGVLFNMLLYYHDKSILVAVSHEAAVYGGYEKEEEIGEYFSSHIQGRLFLFSNVERQIEVRKDVVHIECMAQKGIMTLRTRCEVKKTNPEHYIRTIRTIKLIGEQRQ